MTHIDIGGSTSVCFIVGQPIAHVRTPAVFNAWAARTGTNAVLVPLAIAETGVEPFFQAMRAWENCPGCIVTYPYKQAAHACLDEAAETADFLGACNVVRRDPDGRLVGAITDGLGYAKALVAKGVALEDSDFLLIGAGGAGAAIAHEVARRGVARLA
ncbi:MAG: shikimate dehydrogenase family protein, partial [Hyphomicrobiales bacterium]